jgi:hypothetical protein
MGPKLPTNAFSAWALFLIAGGDKQGKDKKGGGGGGYFRLSWRKNLIRNAIHPATTKKESYD